MLHSVAVPDFETIYSILKSGKLISSSITKNIRMFGWEEGSPYVFLNINDLVGIGLGLRFVIDSDFLLTRKFCLNIGWRSDCDKKELIDGKKLTKYKLNKLLKEYKQKISTRTKLNLPVMMTHEILVLKNIELRKYLKRVYITIKLSEDERRKLEKVSKKYPDVKFIF